MNSDIITVIVIHCFELGRRHYHSVLTTLYRPRRMPVPNIDAYNRFPINVRLSGIIHPVILFVFVAEIHTLPARYRPSAKIVTCKGRRCSVVAKREIPPCAANGGMGIFSLSETIGGKRTRAGCRSGLRVALDRRTRPRPGAAIAATVRNPAQLLPHQLRQNGIRIPVQRHRHRRSVSSRRMDS